MIDYDMMYICPKCGKVRFYGGGECEICKVEIVDTKMPWLTKDGTECCRRMSPERTEEWEKEMREKYCDIDPKMVKKREEREQFKKRMEKEREAEANRPKPKCPTCGSENIQKIGSLERGASVLTLGLFSKKINKTFKCNNCKYTW